MRNERGQQTMGMPFGIIFAIFLIVIFVVIAFIAIGYFLDISRTSGVGMFYRELQDAVDEAWAGQSSEFNFEVDLPSGIEKICFANLSAEITGNSLDYEQIKNYGVYDANVFLIPPEKTERMPWKFIEHLDIGEITAEKNPYCVFVGDGLRIKKGFYDKLVMIE